MQTSERKGAIDRFNLEREAYRSLSLVAGGDEAGRGSLAGPVVAALVILDPLNFDRSIDDSKKLSKKRRNELYTSIVETAVDYGIGVIDCQTIDEINILEATKLAFVEALRKMKTSPDLILMDAIEVKSIPISQKKIVKGDTLSYSIGAASILAKVYRDRLMVNYHRRYPQYGFDRHVGYGTIGHLRSLNQYGPCSIHRRSFRPVRNET